MWTPLSCLLSLAVVMLFSASEADAHMQLSCYCTDSQIEKVNIKNCYEQKPRSGCEYHAFVFITKRNKLICVNPKAEWLQNRLNTGELNCPPEFSKKRRFEVLDEADVE